MILLILLRLGRLRVQSAYGFFQFLQQIANAVQVGIHFFELAQALDLFRFEATNPRRFLEDLPTIFRRSDEQRIDAALLDNAIRALPRAAAEEHFLDVFEPRKCTVDEVLALAVAVHAPRQLDFIAIELELPFRVVEGHRHLGHAEAFAGTGAVENHVGHLAAAQALRRLFAENPLDGIDDVRFAAAVGADDRRHARRKIEPRLVGKRLKANQLQTLEHIRTPTDRRLILFIGIIGNGSCGNRGSTPR